MPTGPRRIQTLPEVVINQIAAGEVVERPASVVKELVENSLDAGADEVLVDVEDGGCRLIRVRDNGAGIEAEDLPLALSRHATSKIGGFDDLVSLASLGFRGEALPSIGSISTLILSSRVRASEAGWTIRTTGGMGTVGPLPTPHPPGTSVEVRDLFFNTPARRKFLRSERTELQQIQDWLRRLALCRVEVRFSLHHNRRNVLNVRKAAGPLDIAERLQQLGGAPLEAAVAVDETAAGMRLRGWILARSGGRQRTGDQVPVRKRPRGPRPCRPARPLDGRRAQQLHRPVRGLLAVSRNGSGGRRRQCPPPEARGQVPGRPLGA